MVSRLKTGAQTLKFLTADVSHLKTGAQTLKFPTADGLTPQNRCPDPEISNC